MLKKGIKFRIIQLRNYDFLKYNIKLKNMEKQWLQTNDKKCA